MCLCQASAFYYTHNLQKCGLYLAQWDYIKASYSLKEAKQDEIKSELYSEKSSFVRDIRLS